jgi:N-acetylglutamate synthase-like GNAT family acetyltransferase
METARAGAADWPVIEALLVGSGLPLDGAREAFATGVVARDGDEVIGAAAVEPLGRIGLLRSVVVRADRRRTGVGHELVAAAESLARGLPVDELYLLTETAEPFFASLGYAARVRSSAPAEVEETDEFRVACPDTAVLMARRIAAEVGGA